MGFLSGLGSVAKGLGEEAKKQQEQYQKYIHKYESLSNEDLIKQSKKSMMAAEKIAVAKIMKSRGL